MKKHAKIILALLLAISLFAGIIPGAMAAATPQEEAANKLYTLGLFMGTTENADGTPRFDLGNRVTREEAVVMLVRIIGKSDLPYNRALQMPFTDNISEWAKMTIGYAYAHGLTNGTTATTFGGRDLMTATQYITLVLRALGYETGKDFEWNSAWTLSDKLGITNGEYNTENNKLDRGGVAALSFNALKAIDKATGEPLFESLLASGAIAKENATSVGLISSKASTGKIRLTTLPIVPDDGGVSYAGDTASLEITTYYIYSGVLSDDPSTAYYTIIKNVGKAPVSLKINSKEFDATGELVGVDNYQEEVYYFGTGKHYVSSGSYKSRNGRTLERTISVTGVNEYSHEGDTDKLSLTNKSVDGAELVTVTNNGTEDISSLAISAFYFLDGEFVNCSGAGTRDVLSTGGNMILEISAPRTYNSVLFIFT